MQYTSISKYTIYNIPLHSTYYYLYTYTYIIIPIITIQIHKYIQILLTFCKNVYISAKTHIQQQSKPQRQHTIQQHHIQFHSSQQLVTCIDT